VPNLAETAAFSHLSAKRHLSRNPSIFEMARDRARSNAIERLLKVHCIKRGFGADFEEFGSPIQTTAEPCPDTIPYQ
jgi:hypothetical protein